MSEYRLFFSWQNDRKETKTVIMNALRNAQVQLAKDGIELYLDQDTRERVGKRNIEAEVLEKIRKCDIFVADLTPAITLFPQEGNHNLPKHLPNSNVMYEYGYALHAKGEKRMIVLASLDKEADEHIEFMPFDINHDTITLFKNENSLRNLHLWIRKVLEDVDRERATFVPKYACNLQFLNGDEEFSDSITIKPHYKKVCYIPKITRHVPHNNDTYTSLAEWVNKPFNMQQELMKVMGRTVPASMMQVKPVSKTTNLSFVPIRLVFINQGNAPLDNVRLTARAIDDRILFTEENEKVGFAMPRIKRETDTFADEEGIFQKLSTLNPHSQCQLDDVFVHAPHDIAEFTIEWHLSSRTYQDSGSLTIRVEPNYKYETIENDELSGTEEVVDLVVNE